MKSLYSKEIIKFYRSNMSCASISKLFSTSEAKIYKILKENNEILRTRSEANKIFPDSIIIKIYNLGLSSPQMGRLLGLDPSTITKRLNKLGYPTRNKKMAAAIRYSEDEFHEFFCNKKFLFYLTQFLR